MHSIEYQIMHPKMYQFSPESSAGSVEALPFDENDSEEMLLLDVLTAASADNSAHRIRPKEEGVGPRSYRGCGGGRGEVRGGDPGLDAARGAGVAGDLRQRGGGGDGLRPGGVRDAGARRGAEFPRGGGPGVAARRGVPPAGGGRRGGGGVAGHGAEAAALDAAEEEFDGGGGGGEEGEEREGGEWGGGVGGFGSRVSGGASQEHFRGCNSLIQLSPYLINPELGADERRTNKLPYKGVV
uniref:Uncharacterized protein n=1 Tax=Ananas comosus var. bracteatus TaxID=296719 RepID=A0A6V7QKX7_ANACO|nr:unnamed protein product [Ananas comosus var. bracteatus]